MAETGVGAARVATGCTALAAAAVMLNAVTHLDLYVAGGFRDLAVIGPLFLLNAIAGLAIGVLMLVWSHWLPLLAAIGFSAATLVAFWISVIWGLFGIKEIASGAPQILSQVAEVVAIVAGLVALAASRRSVTRGRAPGQPPTGCGIYSA